MKTILLLVSIIFAATFTSVRQANAQDIPRTISYQGILQASNGTLANGVEPMTIRLYSDSAGTQLVWEDMFTPNVQNGVFNVLLGSQKLLPRATQMNVPLWLAIKIGESEEMKPYAPLSSSAYALNVSDSSITARKISADYVGSISVNGTKVTGNGSNVNFTAGPGVEVNYDPVANAIMLSGTGAIGAAGKGKETLGSTQVIGTNHQVLCNGTYGSAESGNVTLTLPQNIDSVSTPHFVNISLNNIPTGSSDTNILVSNGGVLQTRTISSLISAVPTVALSGNLQANGVLESGHTIIINGDSMPHSIWSDSTLNISSGTGNIAISAASRHVGIGTLTPDSALEVAGGAHVTGSGRFDGNVGIGTATPQQALDVAGNINASGNMFANNNTVTLNNDGAIILGGMTSNNYAPSVIEGGNVALPLPYYPPLNNSYFNTGIPTIYMYGSDPNFTGDGAAVELTAYTDGNGNEHFDVVTGFGNNSNPPQSVAGYASFSNGGLLLSGGLTLGGTLGGYSYGTSFITGSQANFIGYVLPTAQGSPNSVFTNDGSGNISWVAARKYWVAVPVSSSTSGTAGDEAYDSNYLYVCVATNTWERTALSSW